MKRLKYFDGVVNINDTYAVFYSDFIVDCTALEITSPLTEGVSSNYTESGTEKFIDANSSLAGDGKVNDDMQNIIDSVEGFINQQKSREIITAQAEVDSLPLDERIKNSYLTSWPVSKQLEAFQDKLNGKSEKFDLMNAELSTIKSNLTS